MKRLALIASLLLAAPAFAQLDGLPPPPGYADPSARPRPRHSPEAATPAEPEIRGSTFVISDPVGDHSKSRPVDYLDLREVTLTRLSSELLAVNITFADSMPQLAVDNKYAIVFFSLDLDQNPNTGKLYSKLGIDLGIKLKGYDSTQSWETTVTPQNDFAKEFGIEVARIAYTGQTINLVLRTAGPRKLEKFGLQVGAMANYRSVDNLPNQPPLYIDLSQASSK